MKNNRIFNALSGLDDSHFRMEEFESISNIGGSSIVKRRNFKRIAIVSAVAAAVLSVGLLVGFSNDVVGNKNYVYEVYDGSKMYYDIHLKDESTIPEKYIDNEAYLKDEGWIDVDEKPSELFAEFGLQPLTSKNFTEDFEFTYTSDDFLFNTGNPTVRAGFRRADFVYPLYDNVIGDTVLFSAQYFFGDEDVYHSVGNGIKTEYEWVKLKDGTKCYVCDTIAMFSYDGAMYTASFYNNKLDGIENIKQILVDLGLL